MKRESPLRAVLDVRPEERGLAALMFSYFFLVITSFWILKPLKKALFVEYYDSAGVRMLGAHFSGPEAELIAKILNMFVAFLAVVAFTWLSRRLRRQQLTFVFTAFFMACYVFYWFRIESPGDLTVWTFYLFGDLFSTVMVATFFAFLNDSVKAQSAKRLYGIVGLGGVTGGVIGSTTVRAFITSMSRQDWLLVCLAVATAIVAVAYGAGRIVDRDPPPDLPGESSEPPADQGNPAFEGAALVFRSPYLLSIVAIVGLYEIVSTIMDFQFTSTIAHYLDGPAIGEQFSTVFAITNVVSLCVQFFLTSLIMTKFGVGVALLVLPIAAATASAGLFALPTLWMGSFLNTADNAFSYSINQSAKEALYVPTSRDEKYKAKAFIDMFVQRFAKAVAVVLSLAISMSVDSFDGVRWLSLITIPVVLLWIAAARYAGRHFEEVSSQ